MARSGSFRSVFGSNPFGGNRGGFSQYNIGATAADLAALAMYKADIAYSNGQMSTATYLGILREALGKLDRNDPDASVQRDILSLENKIWDTEYTAGRSAAEAAGLDALISFDMASLGKMNPDNPRYQNIKSALESEMAQRRSRDYGAMVRQYNSGKIDTQALLDWVKGVSGSLSPDSPDYESWLNTISDLEERLQSEEDEEVAQDYQMDRITDEEYLAHIKKRRDQYGEGTPKYEDWNRRLEDVTEQVADRRQAVKDQWYADQYNEGKITDKQYLAHAQRRLAGLKPTDPEYAQWHHTVVSFAYTSAEQQLRFDVENKRRPISALIAFYQKHLATLKPGNQEYRETFNKLQSAKEYAGQAGGGGGGGGGSGGGGKAKAGTGLTPAEKKAPDIRDDQGHVTLTTILGRIAPHASSSKLTVNAFNENLDRLHDANTNGAKYWLYRDPTDITGTVPMRDLEGNILKDANGKPYMTQGTAWIGVTDEAVTKMESANVSYWYEIAETYRLKGDYVKYAGARKKADQALQNFHIQTTKYQSQQAGAAMGEMRKLVNRATQEYNAAVRRGDWVTAMNYIEQITEYASDVIDSPLATEENKNSARGWITKFEGSDLADKTLVQPVDPVTGQPFGPAIPGASIFVWVTNSDGSRSRVWTEVNMKPYVRQIVTMEDGKPTAKLVDQKETDEEWNSDHVKIWTLVEGKPVYSEEQVTETTLPQAMVTLKYADGGQISIKRNVGNVRTITYIDANGDWQTAFSLDGDTWITKNAGMAPTLLLTNVVTEPETDTANQPTGRMNYFAVSADGTRILIGYTKPSTRDPEGAELNLDAVGLMQATSTGNMKWWGQELGEALAEYDKASKEGGVEGVWGTVAAGVTKLWALAEETAGVGAPGQLMGLRPLTEDGVSFLPSDYFTKEDKPFSEWPGYTPAPAALKIGVSWVPKEAKPTSKYNTPGVSWATPTTLVATGPGGRLQRVAVNSGVANAAPDMYSVITGLPRRVGGFAGIGLKPVGKVAQMTKKITLPGMTPMPKLKLAGAAGLVALKPVSPLAQIKKKPGGTAAPKVKPVSISTAEAGGKVGKPKPTSKYNTPVPKKAEPGKSKVGSPTRKAI